MDARGDARGEARGNAAGISTRAVDQARVPLALALESEVGDSVRVEIDVSGVKVPAEDESVAAGHGWRPR